MNNSVMSFLTNMTSCFKLALCLHMASSQTVSAKSFFVNEDSSVCRRQAVEKEALVKGMTFTTAGSIIVSSYKRVM